MVVKFLRGRVLCSGLLLVLGIGVVRSQSALFPVLHGNRIGYVDQSGSLVVSAEFSESRSFSEGLAAVKVDGKWGYIDGGGVLIIPAKYFSAEVFTDGLAGACEDPLRCGFIDRNGVWVVSPKYWGVGPFSEGLAAAQDGDGFGFIDRTGAWVVPPRPIPERDHNGGCTSEPTMLSLDYLLRGSARPRQFEADRGRATPRFSQGRASITLDAENWGVIDRKGDWIVEPTFQWIGEFNDGLAPFYSNDRIGFFDLAGKIVIPEQFDDATGFAEGLAAVVKDQRWGFIDTKGRFVIKPQFYGADSFSTGLASVETDTGWGMIDRKGKFVLPASSEYLFLGRLVNGLAKVYLRDGDVFNVGLIDAEGHVVWRETP